MSQLVFIVWLLYAIGESKSLSYSFQNSGNCPEEEEILRLGLVEVQSLHPGIRVDLKYSSADNFMGKDVYGCLSHAYLLPEAGRRLVRAVKLLQESKPGYSFLVYDAYRPAWAQQALWDNARLPEKTKPIYVANPKRGSIHSFGMALDLTICDSKGTPLDMGAPYDFLGPLAQPRLENQFLKDGKLTQIQISNRRLLRRIMQRAGFHSITSEWWHFNAASLVKSRKEFQLNRLKRP